MSTCQTPQRSPQKPAMRITAAQKQALIDNLQIEVTERARKLRAQYAMQAQSLRARIEGRVNRIPLALRKANMGELYSKYEGLQQEKEVSKAETEVQRSGQTASTALEAVDQRPAPKVSKAVGRKRKSDEVEAAEKDRVKIHEDPIPNPKKRTKTGGTVNGRKPAQPSTVLSPKSANSQTLPRSPIRSNLGSPQKPNASRPASPLKPVHFTGKSATAAATAALAGMVTDTAKPGRPKAAPGKTTKAATAKRAPEQVPLSDGLRTVSSTSNSSAMSTGTTIVKPKKKAPTAAKKTTVTAKANSAAPEPSTQTRRTLRKRG